MKRLMHVICAGLVLCAAPGRAAAESKIPAPVPVEAAPPEWMKGSDHRFSSDRLHLDHPWYHDRAITARDLDGFNLRELALLRNWIFARAGNPFRRVWLHDFFTAQPWYEARPAMVDSLITNLDRENAAFIAGYETAIPRGTLRKHLAVLMMRAEPDSIDLIEIELTRERLGISGPGAGPEVSPLINPGRFDSLLALEDLNDFSRRDLSLLRNLVYARRQRPFQSPELALFFQRYEWYSADSTYTDDRLTPVDLRNINLIQSVEEELGGPVDRATGAFWFGGA